MDARASDGVCDQLSVQRHHGELEDSIPSLGVQRAFEEELSDGGVAQGLCGSAAGVGEVGRGSGAHGELAQDPALCALWRVM